MAYREPKHIQDGTWGAIICIDPHGLRTGLKWTDDGESPYYYEVTPGPYYYLLDTLNIHPGLTDRSGVFTATINDNKMVVDSYSFTTQVPEYYYLHSLGVYQTPWYSTKPLAWADAQAWLSLHPSYPNSWLLVTHEITVPLGDSKDIDRPYDYTMFHPTSQYLMSNDEFWVGVQENSADNGKPNTWAEGVGGRKWIMGGWINLREYNQDGTMRITGTINGQDYTSLWRQQPIGTAENPRALEASGCDLAQVAVIVLTDVNTLQSANWQFSPHPTYFPKFTKCTANVTYASIIVTVEDPSKLGYGPAVIWDDLHPNGEDINIVYILGDTIGWVGYVEQSDGYYSTRNAIIMMKSEFTGFTWTRDIKLANAFDLMSAMCEQADYEWQIMVNPSGGVTPKDCRQVCFYPRGTDSPTSPPVIRWEYNVRSAPKIQIGGTTDLITDLITLNGTEETLPKNISAWMWPHVWNDIHVMCRKYGMFSSPLPPNSAGNVFSKYGDATLVIDDEGYPAVNMQGNSNLFTPCMAYYTNPVTGDPESLVNMNADLRKWRRVKFKFRHATRTTYGNTYKIYLVTKAHPQCQPSDWWKSAFVYDYTLAVTDNQWAAIDIELPQCDGEGNVIDWKGWAALYPSIGNPAIAYRTADPTDIDFIFLECNLSEPTPGYVGSRSLIDSVAAGEYYLKISNPEKYLVYGTGITTTTGEIVFSHPNPVAYLGTEQVVIEAINGDYPDGANIRLRHPVLSSYVIGSSLHLIGGRSISYSQMHFEKNTFVQYAKSSIIETHLQNPRRYRVSGHSNIELVEEAKNNADHEAMILGRSQKYLQVTIDGDPRYVPGYMVSAGLDYERWADGETDLIFHYVNMMIDSAEFVVENTDFYITLNLSSLESRNFENTPNAVRGLLAKESRPYVEELR